MSADLTRGLDALRELVDPAPPAPEPTEELMELAKTFHRSADVAKVASARGMTSDRVEARKT